MATIPQKYSMLLLHLPNGRLFSLTQICLAVHNAQYSELKFAQVVENPVLYIPLHSISPNVIAYSLPTTFCFRVHQHLHTLQPEIITGYSNNETNHDYINCPSFLG